MKRIPLIATLVMATCVWAPGIAAAGGGGHVCAEPLGDRATTEVELAAVCFSPTIVRVDRGATVTWTNRESLPHTVTGANQMWGHTKVMKRGDEVSHRFPHRGVYPYYCAYHPGMIGAVVVGSGVAAGGELPEEPAIEANTETTSVVSVVPPPDTAGPGIHPLAVALAIAGIGLVLWARRRRSRRVF
jgi:plastocyanin